MSATSSYKVYKKISAYLINYSCSGLIAPDTLIRDNLSPILRCQYESETTI
jgi:hypothetical protein